MGEFITSKGRDAKEAVDLALALLGREISEVEIEIIKPEEKKFFGMKSKPAVVQVRVMDEITNESSSIHYHSKMENEKPEVVNTMEPQFIEQLLTDMEKGNRTGNHQPMNHQSHEQYLTTSTSSQLSSSMDQLNAESLSGKAWVVNGVVYCKDAEDRYPLIEPTKDIRIFKNGKLITSTEIMSEKDVVKIEETIEEIFPEWDIKISADRLEVYMDVKTGKRISRKPKDMMPRHRVKIEVDEECQLIFIDPSDVWNRLTELQVIHGLDHAAINAACTSIEDGRFLIAKGTPATQGKNGAFRLFNDYEIKKQLKERVNGSVDFRETREFPSVHVGQIIGEAIPPVKGKTGIAVTGEEIKPERVYPIILKAGTGVILVDGVKVVSTQSGYPEVKKIGQLVTVSVVPKLIIHHDVTIETGNVHYLGAVEVKASIQDNMTVEAKGNIKIEGNVIRAKVLSNKSVIIDKNIIASCITSGNGVLVKLDLANGLLRLTDDLVNMISAIKQLSNVAAFKANSLKETGLGPLLSIFFNSKFRTIPTLIATLVNKIHEHSSVLESEWMEFADMATRAFAIPHHSSIRDVEQIEGIVNLAKLLYTPILNENESDSSFIRADFVQKSDLYSSGDIIISGQGVYSSNLFARKNVKINGFIRGGEIYAGESVIINEVGYRGSSFVKVSVEKGGFIKIKKASGNTTIQVGGQSQILYNQASNIYARLDEMGKLVVSKEELHVQF
nr:FapA family protein [Lysinibacillus timonensis]